jgi:PPOX class probable F420-dependent enzyme
MELTSALAWASERKHAVLITIRKDGRPQSSDVVYAVNDKGEFLISITDTRAKTRNLRRDPRALLHLSEPSSWSYASFDGTVRLSTTVAESDDESADALVAYYEAVAGKPHPDWEEYRNSLVAEQRLLATFKPIGVVGMVR